LTWVHERQVDTSVSIIEEEHNEYKEEIESYIKVAITTKQTLAHKGFSKKYASYVKAVKVNSSTNSNSQNKENESALKKQKRKKSIKIKL